MEKALNKDTVLENIGRLKDGLFCPYCYHRLAEVKEDEKKKYFCINAMCDNSSKYKEVGLLFDDDNSEDTLDYIWDISSGNISKFARTADKNGFGLHSVQYFLRTKDIGMSWEEMDKQISMQN